MRKFWLDSLGQPTAVVGTVGSWASAVYVVVRLLNGGGLTKNLELGPPEYAFALTVCALLCSFFTWQWFATLPQRPRMMFKSLHDEISAYRESQQEVLRHDRPGARLEADRRGIELIEKLTRLKIEVLTYDPDDWESREAHWIFLCELTAHAASGDLKGARALHAVE